MKKQYAVITGAGSGLGKAYAFELAKREINLVLISLPRQGLENTVMELRAFGTDVRYCETDLTSHQDLSEVTQWINLNFEVALLINHAGISESKAPADAGSDYLNTIVQLNTMSLTLLTRALLPNLMRQRRSYILNVLGTTAFSLVDSKTVYPASKAFHHFTRALRRELKDSSVVVSVVHPGPMRKKANFPDRIFHRGIFGKIGLLTPERIAAVSVSRLFKRDTVITPGMWNAINWLLLKIIYIRIRLPLLTKRVEQEVNGDSALRSLEKN